MRPLPLEFTTAPQTKVGHRDFKQIHREPDYAIYSKSQHGSTHVNSYEAFLIKRRYKGQPLPGGMFEREDREVYPSLGQFGFSAFDCKTEAAAFERIAYLKAKKLPQDETDESGDDVTREAPAAPTSSTGKRRGRVAKVVKMPIPRKGEKFTMKMMMAQSGEDQPILYVRLKALIEQGLVAVCGSVRESHTRGKAQIQYQSLTNDFVNPPQTSE
jgi:hypothetical protein